MLNTQREMRLVKMSFINIYSPYRFYAYMNIVLYTQHSSRTFLNR